MKKLILSIVLFSFTLCSGCATIFSGSNEDISLDSEPQGAQVLVNGTSHGNTPLTLKLKKGGTYAIEFVKQGFQNKSLNMTYSLGAGWLILDILSGLIGIIVDASTGNWNEFDVTAYKANLEPSK